MKNLIILSLILLCSIEIDAQQLDKVRVMCIDEVDLSQYSGDLSQEELEKQIAVLGFRYIENGQNKYHKDLIVYDCNTGNVKFTAVFDENRLVKNFVLFEGKDQPVKKMLFTKSNDSPYVDLNFNFKGQKISAYPIGKTEIFNNGKLRQTIVFNEENNLPLVTNYNTNLKKISEGTATISGSIQHDWDISKVGEWKYFENEVLASISNYDNKGSEVTKKLFDNGVLVEEQNNLPNGAIKKSTFYPNGNLKERGILTDNAKSGTWKFYSSSGKLNEEIEFVNGTRNSITVFDENGIIIKKSELVLDKSELLKPLQDLNSVYYSESFYPSQVLRSAGYESEGTPVGVFEFYDESGSLSKITEFNVDGNKINSVEAETYKDIKEKEKQIYGELLVAKTTHPAILELLNNIRVLADSIMLDFDSLMVNYDYKEDYESTYFNLKEKTSSFGDLSNDLMWYDSLLMSAHDFTNEVWAYSHDFQETELILHKKITITKIEEELNQFEENNTTEKNTLFGTRTVVLNEQDAIFEGISEAIYPNTKTKILNSSDKYILEADLTDFSNMIDKASAIIQEPNEQFQQALKNSKSIQEQKQLFLTLQ